MSSSSSARMGQSLWSPGFSTYIIATFLIGFVIVWLYKRQQKIWLIDQIPGPKSYPITGNLLHLWTTPEELFSRVYKITGYGEVSRFWIGNTPYCILSSGEAIEPILGSQKHLDKSWDYKLIHPWLGQGLITSTGSKWHSHRKMLTPAFHFKILEDFLDVFTAQSSVLIKKLQAKATGDYFDIFHDITLCALDIICETAMGRTVKAQEDSDSEFVRAIHEISTLIQYRQFRPWLHPDFIFSRTEAGRKHDACVKVIHDLAKETIDLRKKARLAKKSESKSEKSADTGDGIGIKTRQAFLDLVLEVAEANPSLTYKDILDEVNTFMFAGHDTTTAAMNWFLYVMGIHPEIQTRVQEELDSIFQGSDRQATMADLREMKYLELCMKESLRIFPSVPIIIRQLREDIVIKNYHIPAGTMMAIHSYSLHRNPKQFPDPEVFDPDRFLPENCAKRHSYSYVPFSAGPRNCIGQKFAQMEMKVILSSILRSFRVESKIPFKDMRVLGELILRPKDGNILKLLPRKKEE